MPPVKKLGLAEKIIPTDQELSDIQYVKFTFLRELEESRKKLFSTKNQNRRINYTINYIGYGKKVASRLNYFRESEQLREQVHQMYVISFIDIDASINKAKAAVIKLWGDEYDDLETIKRVVEEAVDQSNFEPVRLSFLGTTNEWIYKSNHYITEGPYTDEQFKLLIQEEFDRERQKFERLKKKFDTKDGEDAIRSRPAIPESVRIDVWRRDGGKCVRCGSRENLEYDHIIPIAKGGSNTARNIELLCEKCNRSKGAEIK